MNVSNIFITFGSFLGIILGYAIILFSEWYTEKVKQQEYRKFLSHNSVFWDPLDWS